MMPTRAELEEIRSCAQRELDGDGHKILLSPGTVVSMVDAIIPPESDGRCGFCGGIHAWRHQ